MVDPDFIVYSPENAPSYEAVEPNWKGFRAQMFSNQEYILLLENNPLMGHLANVIDQQDYVAAGLIWQRLISTGAISESLRGELATASETFSLPEEIKLALANSP